MSIRETFLQQEYGPALEDPRKRPLAWLEAIKRPLRPLHQWGLALSQAR